MFFYNDFSSIFNSLIQQAAHEPIDAWYDEKNLIIDFEIPGFEKGKISVLYQSNILSINATRNKKETKNYIVKGLNYENFSREIMLPEGLDKSKMDASYESGILTVRIQKEKSKKTYKIDVK